MRWLATITILFLGPGSILIQAQSDDAKDDWNFAAGLHDRGLHDRAIKSFEAYLSKWPKSERVPTAHFYLAQSLAEVGKEGEAVPHFLAYLSSGEKELATSARFRAADILHRSGKHGEARPLFEAGASDGSDPALASASSYFLGETLVALGEKDAARSAYRRVIKEHAGSDYGPWASSALGFLEVESKNFDAALDAFVSAANSGKDKEMTAEASVMAGECLVRLDRFDDAAKVMDQVLARDLGKFQVQALLILARSHLGRRDSTKVMQTFARLDGVERDERINAALIQAASRLAEIGTKNEALKLLDAVKEPTPKEAQDIAYQRGLILGATDVGKGLESLAEAAKAPGASARRRYAYADALARAGRHDDAVRVFEPLLGTKDDAVLVAEATYALALSLAKLDRNDDAIRHLERLITSGPAADMLQDALFALGENHFAKKRYADAEKAYGRILDQSAAAHREESFYKAAWCEYSMSNWDAAIGILGAQVKEFPSGPLAAEARYLIGKCHESANRPDAAREIFAALAKESKGGELGSKALLGAAAAQRREGKLAEALASYQSLLRGSPSPDIEVEARLGIGDVQYAQKNHEAAEQAYRGMIERFPNHPRTVEARLGRAWSLRELGRFEEAEKEARSLMEGAGDERLVGEATYLVALASSAQGAHDRAEAAASKVAGIRDHPRSEEAAMLQATSMTKQKKHDEAVPVFQRLSKSKNRATAAAASYELAFAYDALGKKRERDLGFERLVSEFGESELGADALFRLGEAAYERSEWARALERYDAAASHAGVGPLADKVAYKAAWCRRQLNESADAAIRFDALSKTKSPLAAESCWLAGEEATKAGNLELALAAFRRMVKTAPDHALTGDAGLSAVLMLAAQNDMDGVIKEAGAAVERGGDPARVLQVQSALGDAFFSKKSWERARTAYRSVTKASEGPLAARAQFMIGRAFAEAGQRDQAIDELLKVAILYGHVEWKAKATLAAADLLVQAGEKEKAKRLYEEVAKEGGAATEAKAAAAKLEGLRNDGER